MIVGVGLGVLVTIGLGVLALVAVVARGALSGDANPLIGASNIATAIIPAITSSL